MACPVECGGHEDAVGLRGGLIFLAVAYGLAGLVQVLLPRMFYDDGPWVARLLPYNAHLMTDVGALTLASVLALAVAAVSMQPLLVRTALVANLVFGVPHFVFHTTHLMNFPVVDAVAQTVVLGLGVVIPAGLLVLATRR